MTYVVAGSEHQRVAPGTSGIVTLWVRATSAPIALAQAERILANRHYGSVGSLSTYLEEPEDDLLQASIDAAKLTDPADDAVVSGYKAIKQRALQQAGWIVRSVALRKRSAVHPSPRRIHRSLVAATDCLPDSGRTDVCGVCLARHKAWQKFAVNMRFCLLGS